MRVGKRASAVHTIQLSSAARSAATLVKSSRDPTRAAGLLLSEIGAALLASPPPAAPPRSTAASPPGIAPRRPQSREHS